MHGDVYTFRNIPWGHMNTAPQSNFRLLRRRRFYMNSERESFLSRLLNSLADASSVGPLLVVDAPNSLNGLTALAGEVKKAFGAAKNLEGASAFYFRANRFEPNDCHRSLGYYVAIILAWLDHKDVARAVPIESRNAIYDGLAKIRQAMARYRLVFIIDGIEADRGAFEDVLDLINDNPLHELIQNLIVSSSEGFPDDQRADVHPISAVSSILLLSGTSWNQYDRLIRFRESLPPVSPADAKRILSARGLKNLKVVRRVVRQAVCAETEIALLDTLASAAPEIMSAEPTDPTVRSAITQPSVEARLALFRLVWESLKKKDPLIVTMSQFVALCPGGLRCSTLHRTLTRLRNRSDRSGPAPGADQSYLERAASYPMLFVSGDDEILQKDRFPAEDEFTSLGGHISPTYDASTNLPVGARRERSVDIRLPEIRELIVAELLIDDCQFWYVIHEILAEEALDQWTKSIRTADNADLNTIGGHRRLVQAIWHGMQSMDFDAVTDGSDPPESNRHLPRNPDRRFLYIATFLLRRCLEWNEDWLLARGYSRHRLRTCLIATINSPNQVREYLKNQYKTRRIGESMRSMPPVHREEWRVFFEKYEVKRPVVHMNLPGLSSLGKARICQDHLVSFGRAALASGHGKLADSVVDALHGLPSRDRDTEDVRRFLLDIAEYSRDIPKALEIIFGHLEELNLKKSFPKKEIFQVFNFPNHAFDLSFLMQRATEEATALAGQIGGTYERCVGTLLRYAQILAMKADVITGANDFERKAEQFHGFSRAFYVYLVAEALRLRWRDAAPYAGTVSARPSRYLVRVSLKLSGLCHDAGRVAKTKKMRLRWNDAALSLWQYAQYVADVYARRFYRYDYERAYMNILVATIEAKRVDVADLFVSNDDLDKFVGRSFSNAFRHLHIAESTLSRLGFPLAPTRRFLLERMKVYRAFSRWCIDRATARLCDTSERAAHSDLAMIALGRKFLDSAETNLNLLDCIVAPFQSTSGTADTQDAEFWSQLIHTQRIRLQMLRTLTN